MAIVSRHSLPLLTLALALGAGAMAGCSDSGVNGPLTAQEGGDPTADSPVAGVRVLATGFEVPWGLAVLEEGRALVGERDSARVHLVSASGGLAPVAVVPDVVAEGEGGLLGLAVPPTSPWHDGEPGPFYAYATTAEDNRVLRVTPDPEGGDPSVAVVLDGIPKGSNHNGGQLAFGPDGHLYVTTGDAGTSELSQDPDSLGGKILRITTDGQPAEDNPEPGSPVWSLGHRNVQGLDWDASGRLWASEFGQDNLDELNLILPGRNYGWPEVEGSGGEPDYTDPVAEWSPRDASPSGLAVGRDGDVYLAALRGESLWQVPVEDRGTGTGRSSVIVGEPERELEGDFGRLRAVATDPDGGLWVLTSNTFRGDPAEDDDRLLLIEDPSVLE